LLLEIETVTKDSRGATPKKGGTQDQATTFLHLVSHRPTLSKPILLALSISSQATTDSYTFLLQTLREAIDRIYPTLSVKGLLSDGSPVILAAASSVLPETTQILDETAFQGMVHDKTKGKS